MRFELITFFLLYSTIIFATKKNEICDIIHGGKHWAIKDGLILPVAGYLIPGGIQIFKDQEFKHVNTPSDHGKVLITENFLKDANLPIPADSEQFPIATYRYYSLNSFSQRKDRGSGRGHILIPTLSDKNILEIKGSGTNSYFSGVNEEIFQIKNFRRNGLGVLDEMLQETAMSIIYKKHGIPISPTIEITLLPDFIHKIVADKALPYLSPVQVTRIMNEPRESLMPQNEVTSQEKMKLVGKMYFLNSTVGALNPENISYGPKLLDLGHSNIGYPITSSAYRCNLCLGVEGGSADTTLFGLLDYFYRAKPILTKRFADLLKQAFKNKVNADSIIFKQFGYSFGSSVVDNAFCYHWYYSWLNESKKEDNEENFKLFIKMNPRSIKAKVDKFNKHNFSDDNYTIFSEDIKTLFTEFKKVSYPMHKVGQAIYAISSVADLFFITLKNDGLPPSQRLYNKFLANHWTKNSQGMMIPKKNVQIFKEVNMWDKTIEDIERVMPYLPFAPTYAEVMSITRILSIISRADVENDNLYLKLKESIPEDFAFGEGGASYSQVDISGQDLQYFLQNLTESINTNKVNIKLTQLDIKNIWMVFQEELKITLATDVFTRFLRNYYSVPYTEDEMIKRAPTKPSFSFRSLMQMAALKKIQSSSIRYKEVLDAYLSLLVDQNQRKVVIDLLELFEEMFNLKSVTNDELHSSLFVDYYPADIMISKIRLNLEKLRYDNPGYDLNDIAAISAETMKEMINGFKIKTEKFEELILDLAKHSTTNN